MLSGKSQATLPADSSSLKLAQAGERNELPEIS